MYSLSQYADAVMEREKYSNIASELFAKVLTRNDDSGRHGVLIPTDAYAFFPEFPIDDPEQNATQVFRVFDHTTRTWRELGYKHYQRYPERRITRLPTLLNDQDGGHRLVVVFRNQHSDGGVDYYMDCVGSFDKDRFLKLFQLIFGDDLQPTEGAFIVRPVHAPAFTIDNALAELLTKFDVVKARGWVDSLRSGDTGIGYTFETLLGIRENNDQTADFKGIEIKCKGMKEGSSVNTGKINLFQAGPVWTSQLSARERIKLLGVMDADGLYACHSQVTTLPNNLDLMLDIVEVQQKINLLKTSVAFGYWPYEMLKQRLLEKHSRAVFVKTRVRQAGSRMQYQYEELVYCDQPSLQRFVNLVSQRIIVFEFLMSQKVTGSVRNHGYPWRLTSMEFLDQLFAFQVKLR